MTASIVTFLPVILAMRRSGSGRRHVSRKDLDRDLVRFILQGLGSTVTNGHGDSGGR